MLNAGSSVNNGIDCAYQFGVYCIVQAKVILLQIGTDNLNALVIHILAAKIEVQQLVQSSCAICLILAADKAVCCAGVVLQEISQDMNAQITSCTGKKDIAHLTFFRCGDIFRLILFQNGIHSSKVNISKGNLLLIAILDALPQFLDGGIVENILQIKVDAFVVRLGDKFNSL